MTDSVTLYRQIVDRERKARKLAERLLEEKSLVLSEQIEAYEEKVEEYSALNSILTNVMLASPDSIVTCGPDFKITGMNKTAERWFGKTEPELIGEPIGIIVPIEDVLESWPSPGELFIEKTEICSVDGLVFPAEIRGNIGMKGDERCHVVLFIHNITKREKNQEEREQLLRRVNESRRLEAIGTLSSGIAHEINTPLQFIGDNIHFVAEALGKLYISYSKYMAMKSHVKQYPELRGLIDEMEEFNNQIDHDNLIIDIREALDDTVSGVGEVKDIIHVMREFVHTGAKIAHGVKINDLISNAMKLCRNRLKGNIKLDWKPISNLPEISCHKGQIQQVLVNILMNAADALEESQISLPVISVLTQVDAAYLNIIIADNGPGIPIDIRDKIFDPFFTSKGVGKGTGQGLALAKDIIVNRALGELELTHVHGYNTAFKISLPLE